MTRTGHSCCYKRQKTKHGCPTATEYWYSELCKYIRPVECHIGCPAFRTVASWHRPATTTEQEPVTT